MYYANIYKQIYIQFSVQCTFFNMSINWEGGKWCHFSVTNLFILQCSDFWQAGKHEKVSNYKQQKLDLQIKLCL